MKKLMTILGVFLFASFVLTSCGGPEADAKKAADCMCDAAKLVEKMADAKGDADKLKDLEEESKKLEKKCEKDGEGLEEKYGNMMSPKDDEDSKKFWETMEAEMEKCE
mgnify:CR=1 FL=1|tara:strand:+ start:485 stop:808 length:324 start_codon:yes stop_codon:yes gene_type:complete